jgi:pyruvate, orthophosphate dikinase
VAAFKAIIVEETGAEFPQDPREQLTAAIRAVFSSWNSERAVLYRRQERIPNELGTAVNVVAMVFGNAGPDSGTGVCFTRDPATGARGVYGDYLQNAQGEDVVAGVRNTVPLAALESIDKASYDELLEIMACWRGTTGTCATSSSPSSAARCGCCRPGSASGPRRRRFGSPPSWSTRA